MTTSPISNHHGPSMEYFKDRSFKSKLEETIYHKLVNKEFMHYYMIVNIRKIYGGKELLC
jgi:hypothetical protein